MTTTKSRSNRLAKFSFALLISLVLSLALTLGASARSSVDSNFAFTANGTSTQAFIKPARKKDDTSSIYCYIKTSTNDVAYARVNARGGSSTNPSTSWAWCNSAQSANRQMSVGTQYFIYNSVKENGYSYATLSFTTSSYTTLTGVWSPDSVFQSGVVQI